MNDFDHLSSLALEALFEFFEDSWPNADAELSEEVLTVSLPTGKHYLINKHGVTNQIWLASPFTGAHHFTYREGKWHCTRTDTELYALMLQERDTYVS